jgi:hypothetical protein
MLQMNNSRSRLKVFQTITGDLKEEKASRMLEIRQIADLHAFLNKLYSFGSVRMNDCSTFVQGFIRVSFYDIRDAKNCSEILERTYSVKYLSCSEERDYVAILKEDYFQLMPLLRSCGEISQVLQMEGCFKVQYYDLRAARAAFFLHNKHNELKVRTLSGRTKWGLYIS